MEPDPQLSKKSCLLKEIYCSSLIGEGGPEGVSQPRSETQPLSSLPGCQPLQRAPPSSLLPPGILQRSHPCPVAVISSTITGIILFKAR